MDWIDASDELPAMITITCLVTDGSVIRVARYDTKRKYWKSTNSRILQMNKDVKFWIDISDVPLP